MHEPFMGGGLWTSAAIPLALAYNPVLVLALCANIPETLRPLKLV